MISFMTSALSTSCCLSASLQSIASCLNDFSRRSCLLYLSFSLRCRNFWSSASKLTSSSRPDSLSSSLSLFASSWSSAPCAISRFSGLRMDWTSIFTLPCFVVGVVLIEWEQCRLAVQRPPLGLPPTAANRPLMFQRSLGLTPSYSDCFWWWIPVGHRGLGSSGKTVVGANCWYKVQKEPYSQADLRKCGHIQVLKSG